MSEARFPRKSGSDTDESNNNRRFLRVLCGLSGETGFGKMAGFVAVTGISGIMGENNSNDGDSWSTKAFAHA